MTSSDDPAVSRYTAGLLDFRRDKDEFFKESFDSPLEYEARKRFAGLDYYEPDPSLVFTVPVDPGDGKQVTIKTSDDRERTWRRAGYVIFDIKGHEVTLTVYDTGTPGYFLPFKDGTSGRDTYGAGRYLEFEANDDGTVTVDFNMAYNPYCVYSDGYSCPIPPADNWLTVEVEAGEKDYSRS